MASRRTWRCNFPVQTVGELTLEQAKRLLSGWNTKSESFEVWLKELTWPLRVVIDYPLAKPTFVEIGPDEQGLLSFGEFLWRVAKEYERIYETPAEYGVWGHGIEDLVFEAVISQQMGEIYLSVGS